MTDEILAELMRTQSKQLELLGNIRETCAKTEQALLDISGPQGRITKIEQSRERDLWKQWLHSSLVVPLTVGINFVIRHFGGK